MYFISCIPNNNCTDRHSRCFGYFRKLEDAQKAVKSSSGGEIQECYYFYLVIEQYLEGIHPIAKEIEWYEWDIIKQKWKILKSGKPGAFVGIINWAIG